MAKKIPPAEMQDEPEQAASQYVCIETCFFNRQLIHAGEIVSAMKGIEDSPYFKEV